MNTRPFNRLRYYKLLRVAKQELGMDDECYYAGFLPAQGASLKDGRYSATTLSNAQLLKAVEAMKSKGFRVRHKNSGSQRPQADDAQSKKIRALWLALHDAGVVRDASEAALCAYVKRLTGLDALQWLSSGQASTVIETLKQWQARTHVKPA